MSTSALHIDSKDGLGSIPSKKSILSHVQQRIAGELLRQAQAQAQAQEQEQEQDPPQQEQQKQQLQPNNHHDIRSLSEEDIQSGITHLFPIPRGCELGFIIDEENTITRVHSHSHLFGLLESQDKLISVDKVSIQNLSLEQIKELVVARAKETTPKMIIGIKREKAKEESSDKEANGTEQVSEMPVIVTPKKLEESTDELREEISLEVNEKIKPTTITQGESSSDTETEDESEDIVLNSRKKKGKKDDIVLFVTDNASIKKVENSQNTELDPQKAEAQKILQESTTKDGENTTETKGSTQEDNLSESDEPPSSKKSTLVLEGTPTDVLEGGWPLGWTERVYKRTKTGRRDRYWYAPDDIQYFSTLKAAKTYLEETVRDKATTDPKQAQEETLVENVARSLSKDNKDKTIGQSKRSSQMYRKHWKDFCNFVDKFSDGRVRKTDDGLYLTKENVAEFFRVKKDEMSVSYGLQCKYAFRWYAKNVEDNPSFVVNSPFEKKKATKKLSPTSKKDRTMSQSNVIIPQDSSKTQEDNKVQNIAISDTKRNQKVQIRGTPSKLSKETTNQKKFSTEEPKLASEPRNAMLVWEGAPPEVLEGGWPPGWTKRIYRRTKGGSKDSYWYLPNKTCKFNSMKKVKEFLAAHRNNKNVEAGSKITNNVKATSNKLTNKIVSVKAAANKPTKKTDMKPKQKKRRLSTSIKYQYQRPNYTYELHWAIFCSFVDGKLDSKVKKSPDGRYLTRFNVDEFFKMKKEERMTPSSGKQCKSALQWYANNVEFPSSNEKFDVNSPIVEQVTEEIGGESSKSLRPSNDNKRDVQRNTPGEDKSVQPSAATQAKVPVLYVPHWKDFCHFVDASTDLRVRKKAHGRYVTKVNVDEYFRIGSIQGKSESVRKRCVSAINWYAKNVENNKEDVLKLPIQPKTKDVTKIPVSYMPYWKTFCRFVDESTDARIKKTVDGRYLTRVNVDKYFQMKGRGGVAPQTLRKIRIGLQWYAANVELQHNGSEFNVNSSIVEKYAYDNTKLNISHVPSDIEVIESPQTNTKPMHQLYRMNKTKISPKDIHRATRSFSNLSPDTEDGAYGFEMEADIIAKIDDHLTDEDETDNAIGHPRIERKRRRKGLPEKDVEPHPKRFRHNLEVPESQSRNHLLTQEKESPREQTLTQELRTENEQLRYQNEKLRRQKERIEEEKLIEELRNENERLRNLKMIEQLRLENESLRDNHGI